MLLPQPVRVAALTAASLWCAGCGRECQPAAAVARPRVEASAPRTLIVPAEARPLLAADHDPSAFQQASATAPAASARIVEFSNRSSDAAGNTIRQPGAPRAPLALAQPRDVQAGTLREPAPQPPAASAAAPPVGSDSVVRGPSLRSEYVAPSAPSPAAPPPDAPLPQMPAVPNFDVAAVPTAPNAQNGPYAIVPPGTPSNAPPPASAWQPQPAARPELPAAPPAAAARPPVAAPGDPGLSAVAQQVQTLADRGLAMAQRGMLYAGQTELAKSLQLLAQALDVRQGGNAHASALASGLTALREARDFSPTDQLPSAVVDVALIAQTHQTSVLHSNAAAGSMSPVVAQQQYFAFAQEQLTAAAGGQPVASQVLYRLGRLQSALAAQDAAPQALHGPQAMVYHQAALAIDSQNYLAANELGVLLARYGQLDSAKLLLTQSVSIQPQVESWHNLAAVHRRLGEAELARQADRQRDLLAQNSGGAGAANHLVRWVDTRTFAAAGGGEVPWPDSTAAKSSAVKSTAANANIAGQRR